MMISRTLATLVLFMTPAFAETPLTRTPGGHLVSAVRIDGAVSPFRIDTGAAGCGVPRTLAETHLLAVREHEPVLARAASVDIDGRPIGALICAVHDDAAGAIGADVLSRFVVVFDVRRGVLGLHGGAQRGQALVSPRAPVVRAERLAGGRLAVPVSLNGARGLAMLDTGAPHSTFNRRFAEAAGIDDGATHLGAFELAGATTERIEGRVADLPAFAALGLADQPAMILGLDRLAGLRLVIDYPRRRIWFDPG